MKRLIEFLRSAFFFRENESVLGSHKKSPYRDLPDGWDNQRSVLNASVVATLSKDAYRVSDVFLLDQDRLMSCKKSDCPCEEHEMVSYWLLKGSMLKIIKVLSADTYRVVHRITDRCHHRYQDRYIPLTSSDESEKRYASDDHDFAPDRQEFIVNLVTLSHMEKRERYDTEGLVGA